MTNQMLKIILKPMSKRTIAELAYTIKFYQNCSQQEAKYAITLETNFWGKE
jgi:hypothetical protein